MGFFNSNFRYLLHQAFALWFLTSYCPPLSSPSLSDLQPPVLLTSILCWSFKHPFLPSEICLSIRPDLHFAVTWDLGLTAPFFIAIVYLIGVSLALPCVPCLMLQFASHYAATFSFSVWAGTVPHSAWPFHVSNGKSHTLLSLLSLGLEPRECFSWPLTHRRLRVHFRAQRIHREGMRSPLDGQYATI